MSVTRQYATQMEVLQAIQFRIVETLDEFTPANCFILDQPIPPDFPIGRACITISPGSGSFVESMFAGAGAATLTENATTVVTPMVRQVRDAPRSANKALLSQDDGLLELKWRLLRVLIASDFDLSLTDATTGNKRMLLREQLSIRSCDPPGFTQVGQYSMMGMSMTFNTPFDWGLPEYPGASY
ncbi:MAG: hypothetical protein ACO23H_03225 [Alphaproteobacteria bacterium]